MICETFYPDEGLVAGARIRVKYTANQVYRSKYFFPFCLRQLNSD
ncbi:DUF6783 domain-containing protein [Blautia segnis]